MWRHAYTNLYHTYETWNFKWCLTFCCNRCIVTEGGMDKNQPGQKPPWTIEIEFVQGTFVRDFSTRPTKNRGGPRCVTYFRGVPGCVTKCDGERGSKLAKNSMTYFMDGPKVWCHILFGPTDSAHRFYMQNLWRSISPMGWRNLALLHLKHFVDPPHTNKLLYPFKYWIN